MKNTIRASQIRGFTLMEMMVTLIIAAILTSIAVPSFTNLIRRNQITTYANEFATSVNLARSEAIKRGRSISITSNNGTDWTQGWNVNIVATGELLRTAPALTGDNTFTSGANNTVTFNGRGFTTLGAEENWSLCNANVVAGRRIRIEVTGRISITEINPCP